MKLLSLFDGIGCGAVALERAGYKIDKYYASEIEPLSSKVVAHHYPEAIHLGDVTKWESWPVNWGEIDILFAGFPCQSWSLAGKQKGIEDPRGELVYCMVDILNKIRETNKEVIFLFENVKMKPQYLEFLNDTIGVMPIRLNSKLVSAQLRDRYYWTNIPFVEQPADKGLKLCDVIVSGRVDRDKSLCITKRYEGFTGSQAYLRRRYFGRSMGQAVFEDSTPEEHREAWVIDDRGDFLEVPGKIRSLNVTECEALQTLPPNYVKDVLGDTLKAKGIVGNGWTVDMIVHLVENISLM